MPSPSHQIDTAIIATSRKPTVLVNYLDSYLNDLQRWLSEWIIAINVSKSTAIIYARVRRPSIQPRPVTLFREPIEWVDTNLYLGVTLNTRLTLPPHPSGQEENCSKDGCAGSPPEKESDLSVSNAVLLYKQLIRPMMNYACPAWRSAAPTHVQRLQALQSKCLRLATGDPCYVSSRQIHDDMGFPLLPTTSQP